MAGNQGYATNRNVRTRSNGRRVSHGYNYRLLIQHCVELNRKKKPSMINRMFSSVSELFATIKKHGNQ